MNDKKAQRLRELASCVVERFNTSDKFKETISTQVGQLAKGFSDTTNVLDHSLYAPMMDSFSETDEAGFVDVVHQTIEWLGEEREAQAIATVAELQDWLDDAGYSLETLLLLFVKLQGLLLGVMAVIEMLPDDERIPFTSQFMGLLKDMANFQAVLLHPVVGEKCRERGIPVTTFSMRSVRGNDK